MLRRIHLQIDICLCQASIIENKFLNKQKISSLNVGVHFFWTLIGLNIIRLIIISYEINMKNIN